MDDGRRVSEPLLSLLSSKRGFEMRKVPRKRIRKEFAPAMPSATLVLMGLLGCDFIDSRIITYLYGRTWAKLKREEDENGNIWAWVSEGRPIPLQKIINGLLFDDQETLYWTNFLKRIGSDWETAQKQIERLSEELEKETVNTIKERLNKFIKAQILKIEYTDEETAIIKLNYKYFHPDYFAKDPLGIFRKESE